MWQRVAARKFVAAGGQLWLGLGLLAVFWPLNWFLPGLRTMYLFFPMWLGYILVVDGLVQRQRGDSLLSRNGIRGFAMLFLISVVAWWLFEAANARTGNWRYLGTEDVGTLTFALLSSLSFSTVVPAVFGTAELVRGFGWVERLGKGPVITPRRRNLLLFFVIGLVMLLLVLTLPGRFYPLVWGAAYLMLDPVNLLLGRASLLDWLRRGDWRPVLSLALGALITGFFWEFWNYYSFPKWTYHTPGVEFLHVFEMPLLGYLGYPPFALELFALVQLLKWRPLRLRL